MSAASGSPRVPLSFAQFEREVIGERIRDKFTASRKKGMWMGGWPPLGYDVENRRLVVIERERTWAAARRGGDDDITEREVTALLANFATVWNELFPAEQARIV